MLIVVLVCAAPPVKPICNVEMLCLGCAGVVCAGLFCVVVTVVVFVVIVAVSCVDIPGR